MAKIDDLFDRAAEAQGQARVIAVRGAREHNLKNVDLDDPARQAGRVHRAVGLGQVVARLRHHLCRGPAALRRVAVGLRAPVPRDDAEARRRPDRRALAGHLDRAEDDLEEPALDRRHRHRDLRLHAPAVGARRHALLAGDRPADREPDRPADGRPGAGAAGEDAALPAGAGRARPQGRVPQGARRVPEEGLPAPQDRRRVLRDRRGAGARQEATSTTSTSWSTASWCAPTSRARLADSLETALELADGIAVVEFADDRPPARGDRQPDEGAAEPIASPPQANCVTFSQRFACPVSGFTIPEIEPRLFSFNNPFGACPTCDGLGHEMRVDADLVVPDETLTLKRGAVAPWARSTSPYYDQTLEALAKHFRFTTATPWEELPEKAQDVILYGTGERGRSASPTTTACAPTRSRSRSRASSPTSSGATRRPRATGRARRSRATCRETPCDACGGYRLKPEALAVKIAGCDIGEVTALSVSAAERLVRRAADELDAEAERDRGAHPQGDPRPPALPGRCRARLPDARARLRHAVGRREPAHPPRLADRLRPHRRALRARRALDRPAPARQRAPARHAAAPARPRQHGDRRRARRGRDPAPPTTWSTSAPAPASTAARSSPRARPPTSWRTRTRSPASTSPASCSIPMPASAASAQRRARSSSSARAATTSRTSPPRSRSGSSPASPASPAAASRRSSSTRSTRRWRASSTARCEHPAPHDAHRGPGAPRQGHRHRPVADRPHAALQPGDLHRRLHADPRMVRRPARGQGARLRAGALLLQRQGRALRGLPGRRRHQDRDALPARRLRHLRRLQGQALQPRDAGGALQGASRSPTCST